MRPPTALRSAGDRAPLSMITNASTATRQVISRVRSSYDVVISAGIYSVFGFEVTPPTVIAFLTILGYSLYDTIVVFDRVRENERRVVAAGLSAADLVNVSSNQVLLRSLNTSIAACSSGSARVSSSEITETRYCI